MTLKRLVAVGLAMMLSPGGGIAQSPELSAEIGGVVADVSGRPISRVSVSVAEVAGPRSYTGTTDDRGRFRLRVAPGRFVVVAWRSGYQTTQFGATFPGQPGAPLTVAAAQRIDDLILTLRKGGAISGIVRDEFGDPAGLMVVASDSLGGTIMMRTDQQGRYRFTGLAPGDYVVGIDPSGSGHFATLDSAGQERRVAIGPTYHPGVPSAAMALPIKVGGESDVTGIDLHTRFVPASSLDVSLAAPATEAFQLDLLIDGVTKVRTLTGRAGEGGGPFRLDGIVAGRYAIVGSAILRGESGAEQMFGRAEFATDGTTPAAVTLSLERGGSMSGRVVFEGPDPLPQRVTVEIASPGRAPTRSLPYLAPDGRFGLMAIPPGAYVVQVRAASTTGTTWTLKSASAGQQDLLDVPIQLGPGSRVTDMVLTMTSRATELVGSITGANGAALSHLTLLVFSADRRHWYLGSRRIQVTLPDARGAYRVAGLPAGEYWLAAISGGPQFPGGLVAALTDLTSAAVRISLAEGERKRQDLKGSG